MQIHRASNFAFRAALLAATAAFILLLGACTIRADKDGNDRAKKVDIETPFGGIHVNAHDVDPKQTGIATYPGATIVQEHSDKNDSATVNIDSSFFGLKVVAVKMRTNDPPDKVLSYYRDQLKSFGSVLECKGTTEVNGIKPGGSHELSCDNRGGIRVETDPKPGAIVHIDGNGTELKVGTSDRQHIVTVKPTGNGTEIGLVYVQTRAKGESM